MLSKYVAILLAFVIIGTSASAAVPNTLSWQGTIKDSNGDNLDGTFNFTFSIYDVSTGSTALWSETLTNVPVNDGLVSVILGKITPINLLFGEQYYLGISINAGAELPRIEMTTSAYAFRAKSAEIASSVETGTIEGGLGNGHIVPNSIKGTDLGVQQIDTRELKDASVISSKIGVGEVSGFDGTAGPHIEVASIGYFDLADDAVRSDIIKDGEVKAEDIGNNEVSGSAGTAGPHIEMFSIGNDDLADDAVTSEIIMDGEVRAEDIGVLEIFDYHINFNTVVRSLNSLQDFVEIVGGDCIDVTVDTEGDLIWIDYICDEPLEEVFIPFVGENYIDGDGIRLDGEDGITIRVGGEIVVQFDNEGNSYHKKMEFYEEGIFAGNPDDDGIGVFIAPDGIFVFDSLGNAQGAFSTDGLETTGEISLLDENGDEKVNISEEGLITEGSLEVVDESLNSKVYIDEQIAFFSGQLHVFDNQGNPIFYADSSGSYHYVKEHFYEGIEVKDTTSGETSNITGSTASFFDGLFDFDIGLGDFLLSALDEEEKETVAIKKDGTFSFSAPVGSIEFAHDSDTEETKLEIAGTNVEVQQSLSIPWGDEGHKFVSSTSGFTVVDDQGAFVANWASDPTLNPFGGGGENCCLEDGEPLIWKNGDGSDVFEINDGGISTSLPIIINNSSDQQRGILNPNGSFEFGTSSSNNILYSPNSGSPGLFVNGSQIFANGGLDVPLNNGNLFQINPNTGLRNMDGNDYLFHVDPTGNMYTAGTSTFAGPINASDLITTNGGLDVPLSNGNLLQLSPGQGFRIMDGNDYITHMDPNGNTYFTGFSTFDGPVYVEEVSSFCDLILTGGNGCDIIINNNVDATGSDITADAFIESSDERLKENITPVTNALDLLKGINGYYYNLIDDEDKNREIGFIAQQIQTVLPEVVKKRKDGLLAVSYGHVTALLVESVKSLLEYAEKQQSKIDEQENRIKNMELEIANMKQNLAEVEQLKSQMSEMQNIIKTMNKMMKETDFLETKLILDKE